jgi:hypothetical protein
MNFPMSHHLALLLAAPLPGESAMYHDQAVMAQMLQDRGLPADRILSLHGKLDRPLVLSFLQAAQRQIAGWQEGLLFVHVSCHGFFSGDTPENVRPGLEFLDTGTPHDDYHLFWDEFFDALSPPVNVRLVLLPDL